MGQGETLRQFVSFCKANYPSDHTALILWDHGSGWAPASSGGAQPDTKFIAIDDDSSGDGLSLKEMSAALKGQPVACLMAEAEVAWELREAAWYMVASEGLEPSSGWAYTAFLNRFSQRGGDAQSPYELGQCIADT